jgi:hypothetical protein
MVVEGSIDALSREAMAGGRFLIEVETAEQKPELVELIRNIEGVARVDVEDKSMKISADSDLRSQISKAIIENGALLVEMKVQEFSLDDIYMKYFKEQQEVENGSDNT